MPGTYNIYIIYTISNTTRKLTLPTPLREDCAAYRLRPRAKPPRPGRQCCGLQNRRKSPRSSTSLLLRPTACRRRRSSLLGATPWRRKRRTGPFWRASAVERVRFSFRLVFGRNNNNNKRLKKKHGGNLLPGCRSRESQHTRSRNLLGRRLGAVKKATSGRRNTRKQRRLVFGVGNYFEKLVYF